MKGNKSHRGDARAFDWGWGQGVREGPWADWLYVSGEVSCPQLMKPCPWSLSSASLGHRPSAESSIALGLGPQLSQVDSVSLLCSF